MIGLTAPAYLLLAPKANAQFVPVGDIPNMPNQIATNMSTLFEKVKDWGLDGAAWSIAKMALRQMTGQLVNWINSGFNGNPAFISDPGNFFLGVADAVAGEFILNTPFAFLCGPMSASFGLDIRLSLYYNYAYSNFKDNFNCSITQISKNLQNFQFSANGGIALDSARNDFWSTWLSTTQTDLNIYRAHAKAERELAARVSGARGTNQLVANWGLGFKSMTGGIGGSIRTPGTAIGGQLTQQLGSGTRAMEAADELMEMIDAVTSALMNQVITKGLAKIGGDGYVDMLRSGGYQRIAIEYDPAWNHADEKFTGFAEEEYTILNESLRSQIQQDEVNSAEVAVESAVINLARAAAEQNCTRQMSQNGQITLFSAENAIDGDKDSRTDNRCGLVGANNDARLQKGWWLLNLATADLLDELRISTLGFGIANIDDDPTSYTLNLRPWCETTPCEPLLQRKGPRITLIDIDSTSYAFDIPTDEVSMSTYNIIIPDCSLTNQARPTEICANLLINDVPTATTTNLRTKKILKIKVEARTENYNVSDDNVETGILLTNVELFRHLRPVLDARLIPTTLSSTTAYYGPDSTDFNPSDGTVDVRGFDPRRPYGEDSTSMVKGYNYEFYADPPTDIPLTNIQVVVKNASTGIIKNPLVADNIGGQPTLRYALDLRESSTWRIEYTAVLDNGLRSATVVRTIVIR